MLAVMVMVIVMQTVRVMVGNDIDNGIGIGNVMVGNDIDNDIGNGNGGQ